jgi:hypothetical protein
MMNPEDAVKASFDIYARIQKHVGNYQNITFAAMVEEAFRSHPESEPPPGYNERPSETDGD